MINYMISVLPPIFLPILLECRMTRGRIPETLNARGINYPSARRATTIALSRRAIN